MSTYKGRSSENIACFILEKLGYTVTDRNYYTYYGEIDIVAQKDGAIHIVEVKSSYNTDDPADNFSKQKLTRLTKTLKVYCYKNKVNESIVQIDLLLINRVQSTYRLIHNANLFFH